MVGWHHQFNGHEFEQTPGDGEGQASLAGCSPWGCKESDMTEQLNNNNRNEFLSIESFVNTKINGLSKVQCLVNTVNKSKVPNQPVTVFAWSSKKHEVLCYPDGKLHTFC